MQPSLQSIAGVDSRLLAMARVSWSLRIEPSVHVLPEWKGSMLRGALGWAFQRIAGSAPAPVWPGLAPGTSFSTAIHEPQECWQSPTATPPWSLACDDHRQDFRAGGILHGNLVLFGDNPPWQLLLWEEAFADAARYGLGDRRISATLDTWDHHESSWPMAPAGASAATLRLDTPCRLQDRGGDCTTLSPPAIARALLRRWRSLHRQLVGHEPPLPLPAQELAHAADHLTATAQTGQCVDITRWSNRQERQVRMPGMIGAVTIAGDAFPLFAPLFALAPLLHVGKQANFGLGQVEVTWQSADDGHVLGSDDGLARPLPNKDR